MGAQHVSNVLCVREVQGCVHLVQDVEGGGLEEQQGQDEGQRHQRPADTKHMQEP